MLPAGHKVPAFSLSTQTGETVSDTSLLGQRYLLVLYPKDDTPGCTTEVCGFRDQLPEFKNLGVPVYGLSADTVAKHQKFAAKFSLGFPLLSDPDHQLIEALGAWVEKSLYGRKYFGILRSSVLVDAAGNIEKTWDQVKVATHAQEVRDWLAGGSATNTAPVKAVRKTAKAATKSG